MGNAAEQTSNPPSTRTEQVVERIVPPRVGEERIDRRGHLPAPRPAAAGDFAGDRPQETLERRDAALPPAVPARPQILGDILRHGPRRVIDLRDDVLLFDLPPGLKILDPVRQERQLADEIEERVDRVPERAEPGHDPRAEFVLESLQALRGPCEALPRP